MVLNLATHLLHAYRNDSTIRNNMKDKYATIKKLGLTQASSGLEIGAVNLSDYFTFTIAPSAGAVGVLEFEIRTDIDSGYEFMYSAISVKQTIDLSVGTQTFILGGYFAESFRITSTGVTNTYDCIIQQSSQ